MPEKKEQPKVLKPEDFPHVDKDVRGRGRHGSDLGREPEYVEEETFRPSEPIDHSREKTKKLSHKLDELAEEFYLFSVATLYWTIRSEKPLDFIYQFGQNLKIGRIHDVITVQSPSPIFHGVGDWNFIIQGLPSKYTRPFQLYMQQLVFPDYSRKPYGYWRVNRCECSVYTPGVVSGPATIDVFVPTGVDHCFVPVRLANGVHGFEQRPPEKWVVREAFRFFQTTEGNG